MGRRKQGNDKRLQMLISLEDWQRLEALAKRDGTTVSEIIRRQVRNLTEKAA